MLWSRGQRPADSIHHQEEEQEGFQLEQFKAFFRDFACGACNSHAIAGAGLCAGLPAWQVSCRPGTVCPVTGQAPFAGWRPSSSHLPVCQSAPSSAGREQGGTHGGQRHDGQVL